MTTQTKPQATARPWTSCVGPIVTIGIPACGAIAIMGEENRAGGLILNRNIAIANAALIVEAVNQHDALVAVAEAASKLLGAFSYRVSAVQESRELNAALAALESVRNGGGFTHDHR